MIAFAIFFSGLCLGAAVDKSNQFRIIPELRSDSRPALSHGGICVDVSFRIGDKAVYPAHGVAEGTPVELLPGEMRIARSEKGEE